MPIALPNCSNSSRLIIATLIAKCLHVSHNFSQCGHSYTKGKKNFSARRNPLPPCLRTEWKWWSGFCGWLIWLLYAHSWRHTEFRLHSGGSTGPWWRGLASQNGHRGPAWLSMVANVLCLLRYVRGSSGFILVILQSIFSGTCIITGNIKSTLEVLSKWLALYLYRYW